MTTRTPRLTVGMAHHTDFHGVYFTVQALRLYHWHAMRDCEIVVVDNSHGSPHSQLMGQFLNGGISARGYDPNKQQWVDERPGEVQDKHFWDRGLAGVRVVRLEGDRSGTSATRDLVFREARAPAVLVMDCHIMLQPGTLDKLLAFYSSDRAGDDLYSGPLLFDDLEHYAEAKGNQKLEDLQDFRGPHITTHFDDFWRGQMWGTWGKAWRCKCGIDGIKLAAVQWREGDEDMVQFRTLETQVPISACHNCGEDLPRLQWSNHDEQLRQLGFYALGERDSDPPFAIPGCGLGVFTCRRDAWLGFNEHARGFGGEEMYVHTKFRQHGRHAVCLPWLKWLHRFGRPDGVPYVLTLWNKVRNYVLEFEELGMDLDPIHQHFVLQGPMSQADWDHLVEDPAGHLEQPAAAKGCGGCKQNRQLDNADTLDSLYAVLCSMPRDLDQHLPDLRNLASKCAHVTEISKRRESTVALLAGRPASLVSFQKERDTVVNRAHTYAAKEDVDAAIYERKAHQPWPQEIEETELLFIDDEHRAAVLREQLARLAPSVTRWIVLHDTQTHGETGTDGGPGLLPALRDYMRDNPRWSVISHNDKQHGLTVIGCQDKDKPQLPKASTMAGNLGKALVGYVAEGGKNATPEQVEDRLLVCSTCPQRRNTRCAVCGCFVGAKAKMATQECPLGYWPNLED